VTATSAETGGRVDRLLAGIERVGNKLPDPFVLFVVLFAVLGVASTVMALAGAAVTVPGSGESTAVRGLLTGDGLSWLSSTVVDNFVGFPPLGTVLTILLGVGIAERAGLLSAAIRLAFGSAPRWALPYAVGFIGVSGSIMSDSAFVVIPPLAALVFAAAGRHPVAGLLGGFAAAGAGYSTSMFVTSLDALFAGITTAAAGTLPDPGTAVTPVSNWFFNIASSIVLSVVAGFVIDRLLEPRLVRAGVPTTPAEEDDPAAAGDHPDTPTTSEVTPAERRALRWAGLTFLVLAAAMVAAVLPSGSPWRAEDGSLVPTSPLLDSIAFIVLVLFAVPGLVYGFTARVFTGVADIPESLAATVRTMASFIVLAFVLGQFTALFTWSNVGTWMAVRGADALEGIGLTGFVAIVCFVLLASVLNLFIISGSTMWTLLASVFVPLFALLGFEPAFTQAAFRIGDSATQVITPLNPYMIVLLTLLRRWEPDAGLGTIFARMLPFVVPFWVAWMAVLMVFYFLGIPLGPGTGARY